MNGDRYSTAHAFAVEGARIGVVTCLRCGCAVVVSMLADGMRLHDEWHEQHDSPGTVPT